MSAPSSSTAAVGTGTSAIASMSRCPSRSGVGNTPATDSAASSASQSAPCRCATGARSVRSTAMILERDRRVREERLSGGLLEQAGERLDAGRADQGRLEQLGHVLGAERLAEARVDLARAAAQGDLAGHEPADARAADVVDRVAGLLERLEEAHVGVALRPAGAEGDPELGPGEVAGDPGQVSAGQREARAGAGTPARRGGAYPGTTSGSPRGPRRRPPRSRAGAPPRPPRRGPAGRPPRRFRPARPRGRPRRAARRGSRDRARSGSGRWRARRPARRRRSARRRTTASGRAR